MDSPEAIRRAAVSLLLDLSIARSQGWDEIELIAGVIENVLARQRCREWAGPDVCDENYADA